MKAAAARAGLPAAVSAHYLRHAHVGHALDRGAPGAPGAGDRRALDATDYGYQTVADAKWVARRFELSRWRQNLPWSHHKEVAALRRPRAVGARWMLSLMTGG